MLTLLNLYDSNKSLKTYHASYTTAELTLSEPQLANIYAVVSRQEIRSFMAFLKLHSLARVSNAVDLTVVDHINKELRFNVTYQFQSISSNSR